MAVTASGQPESGWILFAGSDFPHPIWFRIGCFFLCFFFWAGRGPDHHYRIRIESVFVHLARFRYRCVIPDPFGLNEARSDPHPAKQIRTTSAISVPGRMVIAPSESDPFLYIWPGFYMDALSTICLYRTKPDPTCLRRHEVHSSKFIGN